LILITTKYVKIIYIDLLKLELVEKIQK